MNFLKGLWTGLKQWYWRRALRREIERIQRLMYYKGAADPIRNKELLKPLSYQDMNLEHYEKMAENLPKPVVPPPDYDDGLN